MTEKTPSELLQEERNRTHVAPHERHIDVQILDALLRIEERLITLTAIVHHQSLPVMTVDQSALTLNDSHTSEQLQEAVKTAEKPTKSRKGGVTRL